MRLKKKCKRGHPLEGDNLIHRTVRDKATGGTREVRECRKCANAGFRRRRKENKRKQREKDRQDRARGAVIAKKGKQRMAKQKQKQEPKPVDPNDFLEAPAQIELDSVDAEAEAEHLTAQLINQSGSVQADVSINLDDVSIEVVNGQELAPGRYQISVDRAAPGTSDRIVEVKPEAHTDVHGNEFDRKTNTVPAAVPNPPKRAPGCPHGFLNPMMCPQCRSGA